jgi:hypothetical protein
MLRDPSSLSRTEWAERHVEDFLASPLVREFVFRSPQSLGRNSTPATTRKGSRLMMAPSTSPPIAATAWRPSRAVPGDPHQSRDGRLDRVCRRAEPVRPCRRADPGEDLIRLDDDLVGAVDPLHPRGTIAERRIDAGLPQIGRFEHVRIRRENQRQHRRPLFHPVARSTFGNRPIAVKVSAVSDPCPAAVEVGFGFTWAEPRCQANGRKSAQPRRRPACRRTWIPPKPAARSITG